MAHHSHRQPTPRRPLNGLWRLPKRAKKRLSHAFAVTEAGLARNDFDWMSARFHHEASRLHAEAFYRLGGRLAGLLTEHPAELPRTQTRDLGERLDRQVATKILPGVRNGHLSPVGLCIELQQRRELRLATASSLIYHELTSHRA